MSEPVFDCLCIEQRFGQLRGLLEAVRVDTGLQAGAIREARDQFSLALDALEREFNRVKSRDGSEHLLPEISAAMLHLVDVADEIFVRSADDIPKTLVRQIQGEMDSLGLTGSPLITLGDPNNYTTGPASVWSMVKVSPELGGTADPERMIYVFQVPQLEGYCSLWNPIIVGHEVAHLWLHDSQELEPSVLQGWLHDEELRGAQGSPTDTNSDQQDALNMLSDWVVEMACDLYALRRFGVAALASQSNFLATSYSSSNLAGSKTHPHPMFRIGKMLESIERVSGAHAMIVSSIESWYSSRGLTLEKFVDAHANYRIITERWNYIEEVVGQMVSIADMGEPTRFVVTELAAAFKDGFPQVEIDGEEVRHADVLNAGWLAAFDREHSRATLLQVDDLVGKAFDTLDFLELLGGGFSVDAEVKDFGDASSVEEVEGSASGVLSSQAIQRRIWLGESKESTEAGDHGGLTCANALRISPRRHLNINGASIDMRIGRQFITFGRATTVGFDALETTNSPREIQSLVERDWGQPFTLHPGELVLGATIEYVKMPNDLTAQVVTRSSYGRLGLVTATAVQVQPGYEGCITLQLLNHGQVPIQLNPGERIAQLVLSWISPAVEARHDKYAFAVGPEFSKVSRDPDLEALRKIRAR